MEVLRDGHALRRRGTRGGRFYDSFAERPGAGAPLFPLLRRRGHDLRGRRRADPRSPGGRAFQHRHHRLCRRVHDHDGSRRGARIEGRRPRPLAGGLFVIPAMAVAALPVALAAFPMPLFMLAGGIADALELPFQQSLDRLVRAARNPGDDPDAGFRKKAHRPAADSPADHGIHLVLHEPADDQRMAGALGGEHLARDDFPVFDAIDLEVFRASEMGEDVPVLISCCDNHFPFLLSFLAIPKPRKAKPLLLLSEIVGSPSMESRSPRTRKEAIFFLAKNRSPSKWSARRPSGRRLPLGKAPRNPIGAPPRIPPMRG